ncbi:MAG: hypothetical protein RLZ12_11 [Bacillota bacterium]|jgi:UDP-N-acetyl-D-glucosamine dehydrogenase
MSKTCLTTFSKPTITDNYFEILTRKFKERTAVIGVIGLGYVGLPLAVEKAKAGFQVIGFDVQDKRTALVNGGVNYIGDVVDAELKELVNLGKITATTNYDLINQVDAVAICVPTPLDKYQQPDISYLTSSAQSVAKQLHPGFLIVLESTTYPGTTEEVLLPIFEKRGLMVGEEFFLAYSPERIDPGNKVFHTKNTPKVVGGVTKKCTTLAATLYSQVLESNVCQVSSPKVAEMEKLLENTFRNINIALANEMAILCHKMKIDVWEVIDAAKTKPHGFMGFYPGPGLGGHCIPIDPFYLTWKAREYKYHTRLIELAGEINNAMPEFVVARLNGLLNKQKIALAKAKVLILGLAYKRDIDDVRESPVLEIMELLLERGAQLEAVDPYIANFKIKNQDWSTVELTKERLETADLVLITTDHTSFDYDLITKHAKAIFDTRNACYNVKEITACYEKL